MDTIIGTIILVVALAYGLFDATKETGCLDLAAPEEEEE